jgi:hypothetical protein
MKRIEDEKQRWEEEALDQAPTWWNIFTWGRRSPHNVANLFPQKLDDARVIQLEKVCGCEHCLRYAHVGYGAQ